MFSIGKRVCYVGDPRNLYAKIVEIENDPWFQVPVLAVIEFEKTDLFPRQMKVAIVELELAEDRKLLSSITYTLDDCECGGKYTDTKEHYRWCRVYKED